MGVWTHFERWRAAAWLAWLAIAVALTWRPFLWHIEYFRHPGPQFYRLFVAGIAGALLALPAYQALRRKSFWRQEPLLLVALALAAFLAHEPKATLVTLWISLTAYAAGRRIRRKLGLDPAGWAEEASLSAGIGFGALMCVLFFLGLFRLYYPWAFALVLAAAGVWARREFEGAWLAARGFGRAWRATPEAGGWLGAVLAAFTACFLACSTLVILAPSVVFDVVLMHLPAAWFYAERHALFPLPFQTYSYLPQGFETLMALAWSLAGQAAAQMLPPVFFVLALLMTFRLARACGADRFPAIAGTLFAATLPFVHWTGSVPKNDLAVAFYVLAALSCYWNWKTSGRFGWIRLGVFLLAAGLGVKYTVMFALPPLALLYAHAWWREARRFRAAASLLLVFAAFGLLWPLRAFFETGNPFYPLNPRLAASGVVSKYGREAHLAERFVRVAWTLQFDGFRHFESPSPNPLGIALLVFAPAWLLARWGRSNQAERITLLFVALCLLYWAALVDWVRYAMAPFLLLAALTVRRAVDFYAKSGTAVRGTIVAASAYSLLFALAAGMIPAVNAPQLRLLAWRLDKPGYLRQASVTYGSLQALRAGWRPGDAVLSLNNNAAAYAPDPGRFAFFFERDANSACAGILAKLAGDEFRWLVLPADGPGPAVAGCLAGVTDALPVYRDAHFASYRLAGAPR